MKEQAPVAVAQVDVEQVVELTGLDGYKKAYVIFRYKGDVLGTGWIPVVDGRVSESVLREWVMGFAWPIWRRKVTNEPEPPEASATASVIVCTRDRTDDLTHCLPGLKRLANQGHEVIVVDSCPSDSSTQELVATYPEIKYVLEPYPGLGIARNRGLMTAMHEFVAFTDDDAVIEDGWLAALLRNFADPTVAVVTGIALPIELETPAQVWFEQTNSFARGFDRRDFQDFYMSPLAAGTTGAGVNMAIRREALHEIGFFSAALGPGTPSGTGDDHEFYYRTLAHGFRIVFDPASVVWHKHRREWDRLRRTVYTYGEGLFAWWTRALVQEGEITVLWWAPKWFLSHHVKNLFRSLLRRPNSDPLDLAWAEFRGALSGPFGYFKAVRWLKTMPGLNLQNDLGAVSLPSAAPDPDRLLKTIATKPDGNETNPGYEVLFENESVSPA